MINEKVKNCMPYPNFVFTGSIILIKHNQASKVKVAKTTALAK